MQELPKPPGPYPVRTLQGCVRVGAGSVDQLLIPRVRSAPVQLLSKGTPEGAFVRQVVREWPAEAGQQVAAEQVEAGSDEVTEYPRRGNGSTVHQPGQRQPATGARNPHHQRQSCYAEADGDRGEHDRQCRQHDHLVHRCPCLVHLRAGAVRDNQVQARPPEHRIEPPPLRITRVGFRGAQGVAEPGWQHGPQLGRGERQILTQVAHGRGILRQLRQPAALPPPSHRTDGLVRPPPAPVALEDPGYRHHLGPKYRRRED